jgi:hypothetical protein
LDSEGPAPLESSRDATNSFTTVINDEPAIADELLIVGTPFSAPIFGLVLLVVTLVRIAIVKGKEGYYDCRKPPPKTNYGD